MSKKFPFHPNHPERTCWGCDQFCGAQQLRCGNGSERTQHPVELFGEDWFAWNAPAAETPAPALVATAASKDSAA